VRAEHVARLRAIVTRRLGLSLDETRDVELGEALARRLVEGGRPRVSGYLEAIDGHHDDELHELAQLLTVGETYFFRAREQFDVLREVVLPARPRSRGDDLRILSAGCSSGEEPYSLAILMREYERQCLPATWLRWHVHAIDLSRRSLDKAQAGVYSAWSLRETPSDIRDRWFATRGREHSVRSEVRAPVTFEQQNLLADGPLPFAGGMFDVIFCRNVLMYFTPDAARAAVAKLANVLAPGGYLFLGHAESLRGLSDECALEASHGTFYYRRKGRLGLPRLAHPIDVERPPGKLVVPVVLAAAAAAPAPAVGTTLDAVRELVVLERFGQALEALELLPLPDRANVATEILRAVAHLGNGDLDVAEVGCIRLLESGVASVEAHVVLALVAEHRGDRLKAIEHHRAAVYLDPDFALSHLHLGRIQRREGQLDEARHELAQALELLEHEEPSRLLLFGGGFGRAGLLALCRTELATLGGAS
jgi:chemotaxis protein methyltransferase CheR